jgi:uncharacterized membrane protein YebE (DUF533 family)
MNDLRKYIDLLNDQQSLEEAKRNPFKAPANAPKVGAEIVGKDGLTYQWMGSQWVQKAGQVGGKGRIATKKIATELTSKELASRGNLLTRIIKKNPKVSAALAAVAGIKVAGTLAGSDSATSQAQAEPPAQSGQPVPPSQSQTEPSVDELSVLKAEIDALIKELESSTDANIKKELDRIKGKLEPKPARWSDNPSIIE